MHDGIGHVNTVDMNNAHQENERDVSAYAGAMTARRLAVPRASAAPADDAGPSPLDGMACFDLYAAHRAVTGVYRQLLEPVGLTYPQYLVLRVLWCRQSATVGEILAEVDLDYGTMSPLLKRLEARGLVERRRRPDDERTVAITLTDAGRALEGELADVSAHIGRAFGLAPDELGALRRMLAHVRESAESEAAAAAGSPGSPGSPDPRPTSADR